MTNSYTVSTHEHIHTYVYIYIDTQSGLPFEATIAPLEPILNRMSHSGRQQNVDVCNVRTGAQMRRRLARHQKKKQTEQNSVSQHLHPPH